MSETTMMDRPFYSYAGNKAQAGLYQMIINTMPVHDVYVELFLGSGAILSLKKRAELNIGNDINPLISYRWKQLCGPENGYHFTNLQARKVISVCERSKRKVLFYADPPYSFDVRKSKRRIYTYEMTNHDHIDLLNYAAVSKHHWIISGYDCDLYNMMLPGWNKKSLTVMTRGGKAQEVIWFNFPAPTDIHDYSYLGNDYIDRQRIKRKVERWVNKFNHLPELERHLIYKKLSIEYSQERL